MIGIFESLYMTEAKHAANFKKVAVWTYSIQRVMLHRRHRFSTVLLISVYSSSCSSPSSLTSNKSWHHRCYWLLEQNTTTCPLRWRTFWTTSLKFWIFLSMSKSCTELDRCCSLLMFPHGSVKTRSTTASSDSPDVSYASTRSVNEVCITIETDFTRFYFRISYASFISSPDSSALASSS